MSTVNKKHESALAVFMQACANPPALRYKDSPVEDKVVAAVQKAQIVQVNIVGTHTLLLYKWPKSAVPLEVGDVIVVPIQECLTLGRVMRAEGLSPHQSFKLRFAVQKVDFSKYKQLTEAEEQLRKKVRDAEAEALAKQFAEFSDSF